MPLRLLFAVGLVAATPALAGPGDHIRIGEAELTPSVDLGLEHRTNVYRRETRPLAGTAFRLAPGFDLALEGPEIAISFGGEWELRKYIQSHATVLDRLNDFNLGGNIDLFRNRTLGLELRERAALRNNTVDSGGAEDPFATQIRNEAGADVKIRFGPALLVKPGVTHYFDDFRIPRGATFENADTRAYNTRTGIAPGLDAEWKFFPRTALIFDSDLTFYNWEENQVSRFDQAPGALTQNIPNSTHFKVKAGLRGRVTERVSATAELGYGFAAYKDSQVENSEQALADVGGLGGLLLTLQGQYDLTPTQKLTLGYKKDFADSWFTNYLTYNHLYFRHHGKYGDRLSSDAEVLMRFEHYEGDIIRDDTLLRISLDGTVALQDWASTSFGVWFTQRGSTDTIVSWTDLNVHWLATFTY